MEPVVSNEDLLEETSKQFLENVDKLDESSRKVSREGLRRVMIAVTRFPFTGDGLKMNNEHEVALLTQALYIKGLADQINKLSNATEEAQKTVVDTMAESMIEGIKESLTEGESNG